MTKEFKSYLDKLKKELDSLNTTDVHGYTVGDYYYRVVNELFKLRSSSYDFKDDDFIEAIPKSLSLSDFELKKLLAQKSKVQYIKEYIRKEKSKLYELGTTVYSAILQHLVEGVLTLQRLGNRNNDAANNQFIITSDNILKLIGEFQQTLDNSYKDMIYKHNVLNIEPDFEIPPNFWLLGDSEGCQLLFALSSSITKQNPRHNYKCLFEDKSEFLNFVTTILKSVHNLRTNGKKGYEFVKFNITDANQRSICETQLRQLKLTKYINVFKTITDEIIKLFPDVCHDAILPCYFETDEPIVGLKRFAKLDSMKIRLKNYILYYYQTFESRVGRKQSNDSEEYEYEY